MMHLNCGLALATLGTRSSASARRELTNFGGRGALKAAHQTSASCLLLLFELIMRARRSGRHSDAKLALTRQPYLAGQILIIDVAVCKVSVVELRCAVLCCAVLRCVGATCPLSRSFALALTLFARPH